MISLIKTLRPFVLKKKQDSPPSSLDIGILWGVGVSCVHCAKKKRDFTITQISSPKKTLQKWCAWWIGPPLPKVNMFGCCCCCKLYQWRKSSRMQLFNSHIALDQHLNESRIFTPISCFTIPFFLNSVDPKWSNLSTAVLLSSQAIS